MLLAIILAVVLDQGGTSTRYSIPAHSGPAVTVVSFGLTPNQPLSITQNGLPLNVPIQPDGALFFTETGGGNFDVEQPPQATGHTATLTWTDPNNPVGLATYNVYRIASACPGTSFHSDPSFKLASGVIGFSYVDTTVTAGTYCFGVYAVINGIESPGSNRVQVTIPIAAPVGLVVVVQ